MHSFIKFLSVISAICCVIIYSIVFLGEKMIPDNITIIENEEYIAPQVFGIDVYSVEMGKSEDVMQKQTINTSKKATEINFLNIIPVKNTIITNSERQCVILGGELFGIKLYTDGVIIVDFEEIETEYGNVCPGKVAKMKTGDIVKSVNDIKITSSDHLSKILQESKGKEIKISLLRKNKKIDVVFKTIKSIEDGNYKAGLWVRDSTAGLGTVTFYNTKNNTFAGLGHPIYDVDTNEIMPIKSGIMTNISISGLKRSSFGNVGELCGILSRENKGTLFLNDETGIYGYSTSDKTDEIPVAVRHEIREGKAQIRCTIKNSEPEYYDIDIMKIYSNSLSVNKDMIIKITDEKLLNETGGIVQGMSGSPIIQDGRLVGAVTHVFVNNPKQGYAIFAERMLETSNSQGQINSEVLKSAS